MGTGLSVDGTGQVVGGHAALAACFALYLAWWCIFFRPGVRPQGALRAVGIGCIVAAAVLGAVGVALCCAGIAKLPRHIVTLANWQVALMGVVAYVALFVITTIPFDREPTTELLIIVGWATLEAATVNALYGTGALGPGAALALLLVMLALAAASLVCYVRFYDLSGWAALIDGSVPLACGIAYAIALAVVVALLR
jgi:hypothetical protein